MAKNVKNMNTFGMPLSIKRENPQPLDADEVPFADLAAAMEYAKTSPTAWVGQTLKVKEGDGVTAYIIQNTEGDLKRQSNEDETAAAGARTVSEVLTVSNGAAMLSKTPKGGVALYMNGLLQMSEDYTVSGKTLALKAAMGYDADDELMAVYATNEP